MIKMYLRLNHYILKTNRNAFYIVILQPLYLVFFHMIISEIYSGYPTFLFITYYISKISNCKYKSSSKCFEIFCKYFLSTSLYLRMHLTSFCSSFSTKKFQRKSRSYLLSIDGQLLVKSKNRNLDLFLIDSEKNVDQQKRSQQRMKIKAA